MALMLAGDSTAEGGNWYLGGLARARGALLHRYFDDIRGLLGDDELEDWITVDADERAAWISRKWEWRSLLAGVAIHERLAEHHRRLEHAMAAYARQSYRGATAPTAVWPTTSRTEMPFDDRGIVYLRHGEPDTEFRMRRAANARRSTGPQRLAWGYTGVGGGRRVFEFDRSQDAPDYFLAEPLPICRGVHVVTERLPHAGYPIAGDLVDWAAMLHAYDPALSRYYDACEKLPLDDVKFRYLQSRAFAIQHAHEAWITETALPRRRQPLNASMNLYAFRGTAGTDLVGYVSVGAGGLPSVSSAAGEGYALRVLFGAGDPVADGVIRVDTTLSFHTARPLVGDAVVGMAVPLTVTGMRNARVTASIANRHDAEQGQVLAGARAIPAYAAGEFAMSDIVIAEDRDGVWRRGAQRLAPFPGHAVPTSTSFRLYHEIYGAAPGDPLHITITVTPGRDESILARLRSLIDRRSAMAIEFQDEAEPDAAGVVAVRRLITADLEPGSYILSIAIRNGRTDEVRTVETPLLVMGR